MLHLYLDNRKETRTILNELAPHLPSCHSLEWQLDIQLASRSLQQRVEPAVTIRLLLDQNGDHSTHFADRPSYPTSFGSTAGASVRGNENKPLQESGPQHQVARGPLPSGWQFRSGSGTSALHGASFPARSETEPQFPFGAKCSQPLDRLRTFSI